MKIRAHIQYKGLKGCLNIPWNAFAFILKMRAKNQSLYLSLESLSLAFRIYNNKHLIEEEDMFGYIYL